MTTAHDYIAEQLAGLERLTTDPVEPLLYGSDLSCVESVTDDLAMTDPTSPEGVVEAVVRRLITKRGSNPVDPTYGLDLRAKLHVGVTRAQMLSLESAVRSEAEKEGGVKSALVSITHDSARSFSVRVTIVPIDPQYDPIPLVLAVTDGALHYERLNS